MSNKRLKFLLNYFCTYFNKNQKSGFTLIELLVAIIIASLIISSLLYLVIDILQIDNREAARNETQREMQMAMDFISNELREAMYVYDGTCLQTGQGVLKDRNYCPGLAGNTTKYIPTFANQTPILAFWKPEEIKDDEMPTNCNLSTPILIQQCNDLLIKRRTYTLVVYYQSR
jgi:prepilin-type N-terminal cleavage/methylation domain-containing protein